MFFGLRVFLTVRVADTARHGLVNNTQEGRKEGQMGAYTAYFYVTVLRTHRTGDCTGPTGESGILLRGHGCSMET